MTTSFQDGPISVVGQKPRLLGVAGYTGAQPAVSDNNPDLSPSLLHGGWGLRDPRWLPRPGGAALTAGGYALQDIGFFSTGDLCLVDQVPSTLGTANLAAAQAAANGTPLTLAGASTGVTVVPTGGFAMTAPLGTTIPAGALVLDGNPGYDPSGQSSAFQFWDPTHAVARAISVTANAGATGGVIALTGYDVFGNLLHQNVTAAAASTVNSTKAFKFLVSAVPQFTDAGHTYSIGTSDIYGLPIAMNLYQYMSVFWDTSWQTSNTGFVAAVLTSPATALTGDVRGTYNTPTASNGTRRLTIFGGLSVANATPNQLQTYITNILGVSQF